MDCYYHQGRESTDNCAICKKPICKECGLEISGNIYCKDCLEKIVGVGLQSNVQNNQQEDLKPQKTQEEYNNYQEPDETIPEKEFTESTEQYQNIEEKYTEPEQYQNIEEKYTEPEQYQNIEEKYTEPEQTRDIPTLKPKIEPFDIDDFQKKLDNEDYSEESYYPKMEKDFSNKSKEQKPENIETFKEKGFDDNEDDYIYPDHSYQPEPISQNKNLEEKYEQYLDEIYEEPNIPLQEQLARDEELYGPLTNEPYQPKLEEKNYVDNTYYDRTSYQESPEIEKQKKENKPIHENIHYKEEKESMKIIDIILTIILIILIIFVILYIVYLFSWSNTYPTFTDALFGLIN